MKSRYWYLEFNNTLTEKQLPNLQEAHEKILEIGRKMKLARKLEKFDCPNGKDGCSVCNPIERILRGEGELVGVNDNRDVYLLTKKNIEIEEEDDLIL